MTRSLSALAFALALTSLFFAGPAAAKDFDAPIDSLGPFKLGQTEAEIHAKHPLVALSHLDSAKDGVKAMGVKSKTFLGFPCRTVALFFYKDRLVRIHAMRCEAPEGELLKVLTAQHGDPGPIETNAYFWRGKDGKAKLQKTDKSWRVTLWPGPKHAPPESAPPSDKE